MTSSSSALDVRPSRERILAARGESVYAFLSQAEAYLAQNPQDAEIRLAAVQGYASLGLATPARRLIQGAPLSEVDRLHLSAHLPAREQRIAWSQLAAQFAANLEVFDQRTGLGAAVGQLWSRSVARLELYRCTDGCWQVFSRLPDNSGWLPALTPHHRLSDPTQMRREVEGKVLRPLALAGLGLGYVARNLIEATQHTYHQFSTSVIVVEPSLLAWAVVLHLFDWRSQLAEPRVTICAGPEALSLFEQRVLNLDQETPVVLSGGPAWPDSVSEGELAARISAADQARAELQRNGYAQAQAIYARRERAWWAQRYAEAGRSQPPLMILGITSRYTTVLQYSMRDWLAAFERLGHRTYLYIEPDDQSHFCPIRLLEHIRRLQPDLIVIIDHLQNEYPDAFPENLPGICWIQDSLPHLFRAGAGRQVRPLEFVAGFGIMPALIDFEYPSDRFLHCEIPTSPRQLVDPNEQPADLEPYRCDVMYATHYAGPTEQLWQKFREPFDAAGRRLIDAAYEHLRALVRQPEFVGDYLFETIIERVEKDLRLQVTDQGARHHIADFLWRVADRHLREAAIAAVGEWAQTTGRRFNLYGHGWDQHPAFARFARGAVEHGVPLGRAYRAAKISLHTGCNPALHRRVLDGLAAGGFFLIRSMPSDTMNQFWPDLHRALEAKPNDGQSYLRPDDVDEPARSWFHHYLKLRGYDPQIGVPVSPRLRLYFTLHCERRWLNMAADIWPEYDRVVFRDERHLIDRLEYYLSHDEERRQLAQSMRRVVLDRFTYDSLAARLLEFVRDGLAGRNRPLLEALASPPAPAHA